MEMKNLISQVMLQIEPDPESDAMYKRIQAKQREREVQDLLNKAGIPRKYHQAALQDLEVTTFNTKAISACKLYIENFSDPYQARSMIFFGVSGSGKTHMAICVLKELIKKCQMPGFYAHTQHLLEDARGSYSGDTRNPLVWIRKAPLIVLDDLGSERPTVWALEQISRLIDYRVSECLPMIITSNATNFRGLKQMFISEAPGDPESRAVATMPVVRIIDRLNDVCDTYTITGPSYRGRKARGR